MKAGKLAVIARFHELPDEISDSGEDHPGSASGGFDAEGDSEMSEMGRT